MSVDNEIYDPICYLSNGKRKFMRVFITYENDRVSMDIPFGETVRKIKELIIKRMSIPQNTSHLGNENQMRKVLVLNCFGAELPDHWILSDLSITPGSTLKAYMKDEMDPILYFKIGYNSNTIPVLEKMKLQDLSVSDLRSLASKKSGLPCSVFRMVTEKNKEIFDCYMVEDYDIHANSVIRIETWDGWNEFLHLSSLGFTNQVLKLIKDEKDEKDEKGEKDEILIRYQKKVAMYIAAHFGHVDLALTMCKRGITPGEPVGLHPLRQWCPNNQHVDNLKAPIHEAVECGQLGVLRSFVHQNITSILCKDGHGLQPLNIALRKKIKTCASFLLSKQWSRIPFNGSTITLSIFNKLKKWTERAKEKTSLSLNSDKPTAKPRHFQSFPLVGQGIYIDGYSADQISSRSKFPPKKTIKSTNIEAYYRNLYGISPEQYFEIPVIKIATNRNFNRSGHKRVKRLSSSIIDKTDLQIDTSDVATKDKPFKFPKIHSGLNDMRSRTSSIQSYETFQESQRKVSLKAKEKKKVHNSNEQNLKFNKNKGDTGLPLPLKSIDCTPRPYYYVRSNQTDEISTSIETYYKDRGYLPREYAIKCLTLSNHLKDKSWLSQVRIAMNLGKESVKKSIKLKYV